MFLLRIKHKSYPYLHIKQLLYYITFSHYYYNELYLNIFKDNVTRIGDSLQFQCDRTLKPIGEQLFRVANEEINFACGQCLLHNTSNSYVIVLALDYYLGAHKWMKCTGYEAPDEHILNGCFGRPKTSLEIGCGHT